VSRRICLLALIALLGCKNNNGSAVSFAFNGPEHVDFACLAQYTHEAAAPLPGQWAVLPRACCTLFDPADYRIQRDDPTNTTPYPDAALNAQCNTLAGQPLNAPRLHALVTQSTRGEVAAVDMVANAVLDSDRQVPGFTFLDTGGLPSAIVVPAVQPLAKTVTGPAFFYVASAEEHAIRAIPTCRFRSGSVCGPDLLPQNADVNAYAQRLRVPLPSAPEDMILGPDQALWVTLPDRGLIMRIALPAVPDDGQAVDAFLMSDPTSATRLPMQPAPFGMNPVTGSPALPVEEETAYTTSCGLGHAEATAKFTLPIAPRMTPSGDKVEPARLYFDQESGLLFVTDRSAPGLHVFRPGSDGTLTSLGSVPTGQPVHELVITPRVPTDAIAGAGLLARTIPAEDQASETKRYLYAIDALGTVMVFDFAAAEDGGLPVLTPLLTPAPDVMQQRYADRIGFPISSQHVQTLALIDTRTQSSYVCGQESIDDLKTRKSELPKSSLVAEEQREIDRLKARIDIHDTADSAHLRGVFVAVASTNGVLSMIDVHDLDAACRAQRFCCASDGQEPGPNSVPATCVAETLIAPRSVDAQDSLAVRRHTLHRRSAGPQKADIATSSLLQNVTCDPTGAHPTVPLDSTSQLCVPADPYGQLSETWQVNYRGPLPGSRMQYAHWEAVANDSTKLTLVAPAEFDLCARGVEVNDLVAVIGNAPDGLRATCPDPGTDTAPLLTILKAGRDELLVEPLVDATKGINESQEAFDQRVAMLKTAQVDHLVTCYRDYVGVELRAANFLVTGSAGTYIHRITTAEDGSCVVDPTQDELINSRIEDSSFRNPWVTFTLARAATPDTLPETRETTVAVSRSSVPFQLNTVISGDQVTDALPSSLQYLPEQGYLFLLDTAGQGLRRYSLRPFERDNTVFR
jgi:hypothetical protein